MHPRNREIHEGKADQASNRIWISWEGQRRTVILSKEFNAKLFILESKKSKVFRYLELSFKTISLLLKEKPRYVFAQNPSIILAALVCTLKKPLKFTSIIDRHTNFKIEHRDSWNPKWLVFRCLSNYSLKMSDYTIVTNKYLKLLIRNYSKQTIVLPDRIPILTTDGSTEHESPTGIHRAFFVCTFADDEPYREVFEAFRDLPDIHLEVTGNYRKGLTNLEIEALPDNIKLLGFVSNQSYINHLHECDFTIVLTNQEFTLNCGAYESLAANKPMLLSNTKAIRSYFTFGANYTQDSSAENIREEIRSLINELQKQRDDIKKNLPQMKSEWSNAFSVAKKRIEQ